MSFKKRVTSSFNSAVSKLFDTSPAMTASSSTFCAASCDLLPPQDTIPNEIAAKVSRLTKLFFILSYYLMLLNSDLVPFVNILAGKLCEDRYNY